MVQHKKDILLLIWERDVSAREFLAGFAHCANTCPGWHIHLMHNSDAFMSDTLRDVLSGRYNGVVLTDSFLCAHPEFGEGPDAVAVVVGDIASCPRPKGRHASVDIDNTEIGNLAAQHLMSLGRFNSYAFVPPLKSEAWDRRRAKGFGEKLAGRRIRCSIHDRAERMQDWLCALPKPAAVMAACDYTAIEVMTACANASLRIPQDIAVIGVDDDEILCEFAHPSLTSIRPEHFKSGLMAARVLDALFRNKVRNPKAAVCSGARIVERESTHFLSPAQHLIRAATAYIKTNVARDIGVKDIVSHLGVSRRLADLRFRECLGKSINETIVETKLEELSTRLLVSNRAIGAIASALGFDDLSYLGRLFRRRYGTTMSEWRTKQRAVRT